MEGNLECSWDGESMAPYSMEPYSCFEPATVLHLGADCYFCTRHFKLFDREFGHQFPHPAQHSGTTISELLDIVDRRMEVVL